MYKKIGILIILSLSYIHINANNLNNIEIKHSGNIILNKNISTSLNIINNNVKNVRFMVLNLNQNFLTTNKIKADHLIIEIPPNSSKNLNITYQGRRQFFLDEELYFIKLSTPLIDSENPNKQEGLMVPIKVSNSNYDHIYKSKLIKEDNNIYLEFQNLGNSINLNHYEMYIYNNKDSIKLSESHSIINQNKKAKINTKLRNLAQYTHIKINKKEK